MKKKSPSNFPKITETPMDDGGTKVITDDGVFGRTQMIYRGATGFLGFIPKGAGCPEGWEKKAWREEIAKDYGISNDGPNSTFTFWSPKPSAVEILKSVKREMEAALKAEEAEPTWDQTLKSDARDIVRDIHEAENLVAEGRWDWVGGLLYGIGASLARFHILESLGEKLRAKRNSDDAARMPRGFSNADLRKFLELRPGGLNLRPAEAAKSLGAFYAKYDKTLAAEWGSRRKAFLEAFRREKKKPR